MTLDLEIDIERLKKIAEAAHLQGKKTAWFAAGDLVRMLRYINDDERECSPAVCKITTPGVGTLGHCAIDLRDHIATFDPPTVLKLIAEIKALIARCERAEAALLDAAKCIGDNCPRADGLESCDKDWCQHCGAMRHILALNPKESEE